VSQDFFYTSNLVEQRRTGLLETGRPLPTVEKVFCGRCDKFLHGFKPVAGRVNAMPAFFQFTFLLTGPDLSSSAGKRLAVPLVPASMYGEVPHEADISRDLMERQYTLSRTRRMVAFQ
jgi:hypothetical protein